MMAKRYYLRRGDICPCCGQQISTDDGEALARLADLAARLEASEPGRRYLAAIGFEWPEDDDE